MRSLIVSLIAAALYVLSGTYSADVSAVESGGIGGRPANPDPTNPRTSSIFTYELGASASKDDAVEVFNNTTKVKTISIYPTDSISGSGGSFACKQKGEDRTGVGRWITVDQPTVTLEPSESITVNFTLNLPADTPPGEQNGCIAIADETQVPQAAGNGVTISTRSAIRVAVRTPGTITKGLSFLNLNVRPDYKDSSVLSVQTQLRNNGNVSLDTDVKVRLVSLFGMTIDDTGGTFPIFAGVPYELNLKVHRPFWGGWYRTVATADYNADTGEGLGGGRNNQSIARTSSIFVAPAPIAAAIELLVLLVAIGGLTYLVVRRRRAKQWRASAVKYTVVQGDDLESIAARFGVSWKRLARQNALKPPYLVKEGDTLLVPGSPASSKQRPAKKPKPPRQS